MIEAVNSAIANSTLVRAAAEQAAPSRSSAVENVVQQAAESAPSVVLAPYVSPFIYVDNQFKKAVLQIRDSDTGEVQRQFPSEETLRARVAAQEIAQEAALRPERAEESSAVSSGDRASQSSTLFAASQFASSEIRVTSGSSVPRAEVSSSAPSVNIAQAQIASAALSAASSVHAGATVNTAA